MSLLIENAPVTRGELESGFAEEAFAEIDAMRKEEALFKLIGSVAGSNTVEVTPENLRPSFKRNEA